MISYWIKIIIIVSVFLVTEDQRIAIYTEAAEKYGYSLSPKRLPLNFTSGK